VFVNAKNFGGDPVAFLDRIPLERVAYVHVAGGIVRHGVYHDTHAHALWPEVIELAAELARRRPEVRVMLERDDNYPSDAELGAELDAVKLALGCGEQATVDAR